MRATGTLGAGEGGMIPIMSSPPTPATFARAAPRGLSVTERVTAIAIGIAIVSLLHIGTSAHHAERHALYEYLYYAPILAAAYWFGPAGGLLSALVATIAYVPHIRTMWADNAVYTASQYGQVVVFHVVGGMVGLLIGRQRRLTDEARQTATTLERINAELRTSHQQLSRAERLSALGELAAGLAHELRNPVAAIKGAIDILASRASVNTPEAEFTAVAGRELSRLDALLDEFLAYARPQPPVLRDTDLGPLVAHIVALLQTEVARRGIGLHAEATPVAHVVADTSQLTQVLLNVLLNSIQASPSGSTVRIVTREGGGVVEIAVSDEGSGITAEAAARAFEPFFTTKPSGSGLGLAIAHRIVTAHNGTIAIEPRSPRGTLVTIALPRSGAGAVSRLAASQRMHEDAP